MIIVVTILSRAKLSAVFMRIHVDSHESIPQESSNFKLIFRKCTMYNGLVYTKDLLVFIRQSNLTNTISQFSSLRNVLLTIRLNKISNLTGFNSTC